LFYETFVSALKELGVDIVNFEGSLDDLSSHFIVSSVKTMYNKNVKQIRKKDEFIQATKDLAKKIYEKLEMVFVIVRYENEENVFFYFPTVARMYQGMVMSRVLGKLSEQENKRGPTKTKKYR